MPDSSQPQPPPSPTLLVERVLPGADDADRQEQDQLLVVDVPATDPPAALDEQATALETASEFDRVEQAIEVPLDEEDER